MKSLAQVLATFFGAGLSPKAPGTVGSAVACVLALAFSTPQMGVALAVVTLLGLWSSGASCRQWGVHDPGKIVIDEVAGQWLTLLGHGATSGWLLPGFLLFRLFDILKPWPVSACEKLPGGLGIMADDLMAGLLANLLMSALRYVMTGTAGGLVWLIFRL